MENDFLKQIKNSLNEAPEQPFEEGDWADLENRMELPSSNKGVWMWAISILSGLLLFWNLFLHIQLNKNDLNSIPVQENTILNASKIIDTIKETIVLKDTIFEVVKVKKYVYENIEISTQKVSDSAKVPEKKTSNSENPVLPDDLKLLDTISRKDNFDIAKINPLKTPFIAHVNKLEIPKTEVQVPIVKEKFKNEIGLTSAWNSDYLSDTKFQKNWSFGIEGSIRKKQTNFDLGIRLQHWNLNKNFNAEDSMGLYYREIESPFHRLYKVSVNHLSLNIRLGIRHQFLPQNRLSPYVGIAIESQMPIRENILYDFQYINYGPPGENILEKEKSDKHALFFKEVQYRLGMNYQLSERFNWRSEFQFLHGLGEKTLLIKYRFQTGLFYQF